MTARKRPTQAQIEKALKDTRGAVATAAERLGIHRNTLHNWLRGEGRSDLDVARLNDVVDHHRELLLDAVESQLMVAALQDRSVDAQKFILGTRGKSRGYSLRTEVTGADGGPLQVQSIDAAAIDAIALAAYGAAPHDSD